MAEKRAGKRSKKRLLVDFDTTYGKTTGFTSDVSPNGLFVRTIRIPRPGEKLRAMLHLADGRIVPLDGIVVRSYRAPAMLRSVVPSGFALRLAPDRPAEFLEYSAQL
jgi:hypothetical protein